MSLAFIAHREVLTLKAAVAAFERNPTTAAGGKLEQAVAAFDVDLSDNPVEQAQATSMLQELMRPVFGDNLYAASNVLQKILSANDTIANRAWLTAYELLRWSYFIESHRREVWQGLHHHTRRTPKPRTTPQPPPGFTMH